VCGGFGSYELVFRGGHEEVQEIAAGRGGGSFFCDEGERALAEGRRHRRLEESPRDRVGGLLGREAGWNEFIDVWLRPGATANEVSGGVVADE